jgi:superfamily II DNA or RNA helicase
MRLDKELKYKVKELFQYEKTWWKKDEDGYKMAPEYNAGYLFGRTSFALTSNLVRIGDLPRIKAFCKKERIPIRVKYKLPMEFYECESTAKPKLKGITFRDDQLDAINASRDQNYGRIVAPTGSGKTITMLGICSMHPDANILILAHTKDLVMQLSSEANKYQINLAKVYPPAGVKTLQRTINKVGNLSGEANNGIVISTIQSFARLNMTQNLTHTFDIIIVDEVHRVARPDSQYGNILQTMQPPRRYGFTATPPKKQPDAIYNEGLFGPVIAELKEQKALQENIIAMPTITLLNVPYNVRINQQAGFNYKDIYQQCIVENPDRNQLVVNEVKYAMAFNHSTLVIIDKIEHGKILKQMLWRQCHLEVPFVRGKLTGKERTTIKNKLLDGKLLVVICSKVWMEGINIPNLRKIVYAAGLKEEKRVLQAMGRGLRVTETKDTITLVDFLDPYKYIAQHSILRVQIYNERKWFN